MLDKRLFLIPLTALLLAGCVEDDESVEPNPNPNDAAAVGFQAKYVPLAGIAPFPNDIYLGADATVAPPGVYDPKSATDAQADFGDPLQAMSTLDGWGLYAPISVFFNDSVDASTLVAGQTVLGFKILDKGVTVAPVPVAFNVALSPAQDTGLSIVYITPTTPLDPLGTYAFFVTSGVKSTTGASVEASPVFQTIKDAIANGTTLDDAQLEAIKSQAIAPLMPLAAAIGLPAENIAVAWTVTTQSAGPVLQTLQATVQPQESAFVPVPKDPANPAAGVATTADLDPRLAGHADVYVGAMEIPYYLSATDPLADFWNAPNGEFLNAIAGRLMPEQNGVLTIPVILTVPNSSSATGGTISGVVIFQHGITQDRLNALAVADALADTGHAVIAIDLPLHGLTDVTNGLYASPENPLYGSLAQLNADLDVSALTEATLNLDVVNNTTGAPGGDGVIDTSGKHFINLASLLTARDNVRQGIANLMTLTATIPTIDYNAALDGGLSGTDFDGLDIHFVGHSLGAIVGTSFLAVNDTVTTATLAMPGGGLSQLFLNSPTFLPEINAGLAEKGLVPGTQLYYNFFRNAQTVVGKGDPINYGAAAEAAHPVHMIEVVGGNSSLPDQVIPNLATEALADVMGLDCIDATTGFPTGEGLVRFLVGDHGSILDPTASLEATTEMQTEMATFVATSHIVALPFPSVFGSTGPVNPDVIAPCPVP